LSSSNKGNKKQPKMITPKKKMKSKKMIPKKLEEMFTEFVEICHDMSCLGLDIVVFSFSLQFGF